MQFKKKVAMFVFFSVQIFNTLNGEQLIEKPLAVVITAYQCEQWCIQSLDSIFTQDYSNFYVIFIDDCSTDKTADLVEAYINKHGLQDRLFLIRNIERRRKMHNIYNVYHKIPDDHIIIQIDGDDRLFSCNQIFKKVNETYQKNKVWITYGQYIKSNGAIGLGAPVPKDILRKRDFRKWKFVYYHLRTFYSWLFKQIKLQDVITSIVPGFAGKFYPCSNDLAFMFPMMEMAGNRFKYFNEILYWKSYDNPISGFRIESQLQNIGAKEIRSRPKYKELASSKVGWLDAMSSEKADVIMLLSDSSKLEQSLNCLFSTISGIGKVFVLMDTVNDGLNHLQTPSNVFFFSLLNKNWKETVFELLNGSVSNQILCISDDTTFDRSIKLAEAVRLLEQTGAHSFHFNLTKSILLQHVCEVEKSIPIQYIENDLYTWKLFFTRNSPDLNYNFDGVLYRKSEVLNFIKIFSSNRCTDFRRGWQKIPCDQHKIGLFYDVKGRQ